LLPVLFAHRSSFPHCSIALHPAIRVDYFKSDQWDTIVAVRAKSLLTDIVKKYAQEHARIISAPAPKPAASSSSTSVLARAMALGGTSRTKTAVADGKAELNLYLGDISPVAEDFDDPLAWWKVCIDYPPHVMC
jgi:hypothetical protein